MTSTDVAALNIPNTEVRLDAEGRIDEDVQCRRCGYNLHGIATDTRCPECGTAVGRSLQGDLLHFSDPDWVQTLASGMNWIVMAIVLVFLLGCVGVGVAAAAGSADPELVILAVTGIATIVQLVGYWKVTTPDPGSVEEEGGWDPRKLARSTFFIFLGLTFIGYVILELIPILGLLIVFAADVVYVVFIISALTYAQQLALRIPDERLAAQCNTVKWGLGIFAMLSALTTPLEYLAAWNVGGGAATPPAGGPPAVAPTGGMASGSLTMLLVGLGGLLGIIGLVFGVWSLILILRFRRAMNDAAALARATWAARAAPVPQPPA